jgi:carbon-monoxide dehydrogenase medium subunit
MYETRYHRPSTLAEARALFTPDARYIAGGQTLLPVMKQRVAAPSDLIDIARLAELKGIAASAGILTIGGGTTHAEVAGSDVVRRAIPALAELAGIIGDPAVRHMGTIGGSLANNDPAADYAAAALALNATIHTDQRAIAADDYIQGLFASISRCPSARPTKNSAIPPRATRLPRPSSRRRAAACASPSPVPATMAPSAPPRSSRR